MSGKPTKYSYEIILSELLQKIYRPIYFLEGLEPYYIDKISSFIEHNVLDEMEREFNQTILYGKDIDVLTLIGEAKRFPMMADKQVVVVREAQELKDLEKTISTKGSDGKAANINLFEEYVKNPTVSTILVICYKYKNAKKKLRITELIFYISN